jgi:hypothetical protein
MKSRCSRGGQRARYEWKQAGFVSAEDDRVSLGAGTGVAISDTSRQPRQAIIGNLLPHRGAGDVHPGGGPDSGVAVQRAQSDVDDLRVPRALREKVRAARPAEDLVVAVTSAPPRQIALAAHQPERPGLDSGGGRGRGAASPLTTGAVAVDGAQQRCTYFEADSATVAATGQRQKRAGHGRHNNRAEPARQHRERRCSGLTLWQRGLPLWTTSGRPQLDRPA